MDLRPTGAIAVDVGGAAPTSAAERPAGERRRYDPGVVTVGEVAVLGAATAVAVVALVSLAAAHLGVHSLGSVAAGTAAVLLVLAALARWRSAPPHVVLDLGGLAALAGSGVVALVMFLPGFHYFTGDKDPAGYVMHAFAIARTGSYSFTDTLLATPGLPVQLAGPGARFPGLWVENAATGEIVPQFYHLWPALLATSLDVRGPGGLANTVPLVGALAVLLAVAITRRLAGPWVAAVAGVLLATNMMQAWQARYQTAEILAQLLFLGTLLGVVLAVQTRWRWPALVAGLLVGVGYLDRADALVVVLGAVGVLATLWVLRRFDARAAWFTAGFATLLPYGLWQAYGPAGLYTGSNGVPGLPTVLVLVGLCVAGALVLRPPVRPLATWVDRRVAEPTTTQRRLGAAAVLGAVGLFGLGLARPLLGDDWFRYNGRLIRSYDEINVFRLSWFFSWPGLLLMLAGVAWVALRRWSASAWLVVAPTVLLLALYCWHMRNSTYFMWVGRRLVPSVVPGMAVLIALGLAAVWALRVHGRGVRASGAGLRVGAPLAALLAAFVLAVQLNQSWPLRAHDEWGGSYGVGRSVAELSGDRQGIYLWEPAKYCCAAPQALFAPPVWLIHDEQSALLPRNVAQTPAYVRAYLTAFPDRPVFLVYEKPAAAPALASIRVTEVRRFTGSLPHWLESSISRPAAAQQVPYDFTVYRAEPG